MAKSKNGGSRAYIRGRIGSDVYSVGKNGMGEKQQVVRSLAEQVSNPRTSGQMFGRMIMSTVMQAVSSLTEIIDHSFDGVPKGQPSISQFIKTNYALVKADAIAHPSSDNLFGLVKYQEKGIRPGAYKVSDGNIVKPTAVVATETYLSITLPEGHLTVGDLKSVLGLSADGFLTYVRVEMGGHVTFFRVQLTTTLADSTTINASNVASLFTISGNDTPQVAISSNIIMFQPTLIEVVSTQGVIVSEKVEGAWKHNSCVLAGDTDIDWMADTALPTYPTGAQMFLNGGEL